MLLIGMFDSPFVRRVAITMKLQGIAFEHGNWSVGKDFERISQYNPLGRVPTLVLDDGEALIESAAILDYLDERADPEHALIPRSGKARRDALRLMALATGSADKGVMAVYERAFRPEAKRHQPWVARCLTQVHSGLGELEKACMARGRSNWLIGESLSQADITLTCVATFLSEALPVDMTPYPHIQALAARCEALPEFHTARLAFFTPG